jgi:hypothetical protein
MVAGTAFAAVLLRRLLPIAEGPATAAAELERGVASVLAVLLAAGSAYARLDARAAILWDEAVTRSARVDEILGTAAERDATAPIAAAAVLVVAAAVGLRLRDLIAGKALPRIRPRTWVLGALLGLAVAADVVGTLRFRAVGERVRASLESQFRMFARLDPPPMPEQGAGLSAPRPARAMQVTRDAVAIDGELVAKLGALDSERTVDLVSSRLTQALAAATEADERASSLPSAPAPDLSVLADREVKWGTLRRLLALAREAGARHVEVLLTRGPSPRIPERGPPEAGYVIARDFVAVTATLDDAGFDAPDAARFGDVAPALAAARPGAPLAVRRQPPK